MPAAGLTLGLSIATVTIFAVIGIWYSRGRIHGIEDYLAARGTTGLGATTATLVASVMGGWILFSPAEAGAGFGGLSAVIGYALGSAGAMLAYIVVAPRVRALIPEGHTLTEYALARYGPVMLVYVLFVSVFYMGIFLAANLSGLGAAFVYVAGVPAWATTGIVGLMVLAYTAYGGLKASILTDTLQTLVILPLLAVAFVGTLLALGGTSQVHAAVLAAQPTLLDPGFGPGLLFGATVIIAIVGAELVNQMWWQRIYAARDTATIRRGFALAALVIFPMLLLAGLFGVIGQGLGHVPEGGASIALFALVLNALPGWIMIVVILLALLLVMSTMDTLLNAIASIATVEIPRVAPGIRPSALTTAARVVTGLAALAAVLVAARGYSVLTLFLTADLFAAATFIPLLYGLWSKRAGQWQVVLASVAGLVAGVAYFPLWRTWLAELPVVGTLLPGADMLYAFAAAAAVSGGLTVLLSLVSNAEYDHAQLARDIRLLDEADPGAPTRASSAPAAAPPEGGDV